MGRQLGAGLPAVDVVGVAHAVGGVAHVVGRAQDGVHGAQRCGLGGEAHVDGPGPGVLDVVADGRTGARAEDQDDGAEPGREGVGGHQVDDGLAVGAHGRQRLAAAVPPGPPGRQDHQRRVRPAAVLAHALQRKTALAQVMPPPNPVRRRWSPSLTRPCLDGRRSRASGMEADEVLP